MLSHVNLFLGNGNIIIGGMDHGSIYLLGGWVEINLGGNESPIPLWICTPDTVKGIHLWICSMVVGVNWI